MWDHGRRAAGTAGTGQAGVHQRGTLPPPRGLGFYNQDQQGNRQGPDGQRLCWRAASNSDVRREPGGRGTQKPPMGGESIPAVRPEEQNLSCKQEARPLPPKSVVRA